MKGGGHFYDAAGNVCRTVDAAGNETAYEYDRTGTRIKETDAAGGTRVYTYIPLGNQALYTYNGRDELTSVLRLSGDKNLAEVRELNGKNGPSCLAFFKRNSVYGD